MESFIKRYFQESEYGHKIELKIGDAVEIMHEYENKFFDLIFIDGNKRDYCAYYTLPLINSKRRGYFSR